MTDSNLNEMERAKERRSKIIECVFGLLAIILIGAAVLIGIFVAAPRVRSDELTGIIRVPMMPPTFAESVNKGKPIVLFIGCEPRMIDGVIVAAEPSREGYPRACVAVSSADGYWLATLGAGASASDGDILAASVRKVVMPQVASPFDTSSKEPWPIVDGSSPWLPVREQERIRSLLPKSLKVGNLKFYSLPRRYQNLFTMSGGSRRFNVPTSFDEGWPADLRVSGGMAGLNGWESYKGIDLPADAKISVWKESTDVRAFSFVDRWRWRFPEGTVAYDVLVGPNGKVFEVRTRGKEGGIWYTSTVYKDSESSPVGFHGAGQACASCHNRASQLTTVPGRIYLHAIWGDDNIFSWRPFGESGAIDNRWPIERK